MYFQEFQIPRSAEIRLFSETLFVFKLFRCKLESNQQNLKSIFEISTSQNLLSLFEVWNERKLISAVENLQFAALQSRANRTKKF